MDQQYAPPQAVARPELEFAYEPTGLRRELRSKLALDREHRRRILETLTRDIDREVGIDLELVSTRARGLTGPELKRLVGDACRLARSRGGRLGTSDLLLSLAELELIVGNHLIVGDAELERRAYYEAGMVLVGETERGADRVRSASVFPSARVREEASLETAPGHRLRGEASRRARITGLLAGAAALRYVYEDEDGAARSDWEQALVLARRHAARWPFDGRANVQAAVPALGEEARQGIPSAAEDDTATVESEALRILAECQRRAERLLRTQPGAFVDLARALIENETLAQPALQDLLAALVSRPRAHRVAEADICHQSEPVMSVPQRLRYWALGALWLLVNVTFWIWWADSGSGRPTWLYWLQSITLLYQATLLPTVYWAFVGRMRRPVELSAAAGVKVAMITLCVPSHESLGVIVAQLDALQGVRYPHDSWILDEGASADVRALAEERGVRYFSRRGIAAWNEPAPPFQAATKAGNVNAWLDHVASLGFDYEVFVQLDIDHHPRPDYLDRTLGYFRDRRVAWVQAPSVCGNTDNWAARGLAEQDLVFHGPLQMGFYGHSRTPFIIGSHTSYRTSAIREIGGFQPTRAEDHLDTVLLAAHGYEGVFVPDLIAVGDGPDDFATYLRQQFAWAYSMIQIFIDHTPRLIRRYSLRQAFQFLFCQSWYTLWSISLAMLWALPAIALLTGQPISSVKLSKFLLYFAPLILGSCLMWCETRRWFQPGGVKLSWRGVLLGVARWPVVLWALVNVLLHIKRPYMITPKGVAIEDRPPSLGLYGPGLALASLPLLALWIFRLAEGGGSLRGYYLLVLLNAAIGLLLVITTVTLELRSAESKAHLAAAIRHRAPVLIAAAAVTVWLAASTVVVWHPMTQVIS